VYVYRCAPFGEKHAKQVVLKLNDGSAGSLLGVGFMEIAGKGVLLCLCEGMLVVIRNLF